MDYVIGILIFGAIIAACVRVVYTKRIEWERRKAIGFPENTKEKLEEFHTDLKIARHILVCKKLGIPESTPMSKTQGL